MRSLAVAFFVGVSFGSFHSPMVSLGPAGCTLASHNPDEMSVVTPPPREDKLSERLEEMGKELDKMKQFAGHKGSQLLLEETDKILKEMKRFTDKLQSTMIGNNVSNLQLEVQFMRLRAQSGSENLRKKMEVQENQASETKSVTPAVLEQPPAGEDGKEEAEQELEDDTMGSQEKNRSFFTAGRNWLEAFSDSEDPPPQDQPAVDDSKVVIIMSDNRWNEELYSLQLMAAINKGYARRHGYRFETCDYNDETLECRHDYPPAVCKIHCVQRFMNEGEEKVKHVMYMDSDAIFRDFNQSLLGFVEENFANYSRSNWDVVLPTDCGDYVHNTGLQFWRNSERARYLLEDWRYECYDRRRYKWHPWEQWAFKAMYVKRNTTILQQEGQVGRIPWGLDTWHVGTCSKRKKSFKAPRFAAHITSRWTESRLPEAIKIMKENCGAYLDEPKSRVPAHCLPMMDMLANPDPFVRYGNDTGHHVPKNETPKGVMW